MPKDTELRLKLGWPFVCCLERGSGGEAWEPGGSDTDPGACQFLLSKIFSAETETQTFLFQNHKPSYQ